MEEEHKEEGIIETKTENTEETAKEVEPVKEETPEAEEVEEIEKAIISEEKPKKTGAGSKIMAAFFFVATLGLGAFLIYHYMTFDHNPKAPEKKDEPVAQQKEEKTEKKDENGKTISETTVSNVIVSSDEHDNAVRTVISELKTAVDEATRINYNSYTLFTNVFDHSFPLVKLDEAKVALRLQKSYGLFSSYNTLSAFGAGTEFLSLIDKTFSDKLTELGFVKSGDIAAPFISGEHLVNTSTGVICYVSFDYIPYEVSCGHKSWISQDTIKLANSLAEAFAKKNDDEYPFTIGAGEYTIKDSLVSPYQTLTVAIENAAGLFYRVDSESDWELFSITQDLVSCSEYNTRDYRNAFAGEKCWDSSLQKELVVEAWEEE